MLYVYSYLSIVLLMTQEFEELNYNKHVVGGKYAFYLQLHAHQMLIQCNCKF